MLRRLSLTLRQEEETQLPLSHQSPSVQMEQLLDLSENNIHLSINSFLFFLLLSFSISPLLFLSDSSDCQSFGNTFELTGITKGNRDKECNSSLMSYFSFSSSDVSVVLYLFLTGICLSCFL